MKIFQFLFKKNTNIETKKIDKSIPKIEGIPFGFRNMWFAFKTNDFELVTKKLSEILTKTSETDLKEGLKEGWNGNFCLLKPISGWTILVSSSGYKIRETIRQMSAQFPEIQFFATHGSSNYMVCSKFYNGEAIRDFSIGDGAINFNIGMPTEIEIEVAKAEKNNLTATERDASMIEFHRTRELLEYLGDPIGLMKIAGSWSIDPSNLNKYEVEDYALVYKTKANMG
jgi:hypothetical protein